MIARDQFASAKAFLAAAFKAASTDDEKTAAVVVVHDSHLAQRLVRVACKARHRNQVEVANEENKLSAVLGLQSFNDLDTVDRVG